MNSSPRQNRSSRPFAATVVVALSFLAGVSAGAADQLAPGDAGMLKDIAQANMAEIETGKIALEKSSNVEVKKFAQMMVDDHSKGLADVRKLVTAKGAELPDGTDMKHKAIALEFKALTGHTFDSRYVKQAGVADHKATEKLLKKTQADAKDADLKDLAGKMLPVVQTHLQHAQELAASVDRK